MKRKEIVISKVKTTKLKLAIILSTVVFIFVLLQYTPLMKWYWIKAVIVRIVQNKWNAWFISFVLVALHFIEKKMFIENNEKYFEKGEK